jgi:hypothetical protein
MAEEEALASERAAARPGAMTGAPMGHGAEGDKDTEHKRKIPLTEDPEIFTGTDRAAPQVLGETEADYEARIAKDSGISR